MPERFSALAELAVPLDPGRTTRVVLKEMRPASILQVHAWPDAHDTVEAVVTQVLGVTSPPKSGRAVWFNGGSVCNIGAGRFLLLTSSDEIAQDFRTAFASDHGAITDLSHARTVLRLEGEAATELLSRCVALDFDPAVFPADRVAQTAIHHVDVLVHRLTETSFDIWALRSFAHSLAEWMLDAGAELDVQFQDNVSPTD